MHLFTNDDGDGRSSEKAIGFNVPAGAFEQGVAGGSEGGEVRHRGPGDYGSAGPSGKTEDLAHPVDRGLLQLGRYGRLRVMRGVLIPRADQPTGCESRWQAVAGDEAEEAAIGLGHGCRRAVFMEQ